LLEAVQRWANDDLRSLNGQIEFLLRRALQQAGKKIPIIGVDANEDALKSILAGDLYASVAQGNYDMGRLAIEKAIAVKAGQKVDKRIDSGATMMTKANAQSLLDFRMSIK